MNLLLATLAAPLATAAIGAIPGPRRPKEAVFLGGLAATFVLALATAGRYLAGETPAAFGGALRVDGLSALVLVLTAFVGLLSGLYSVGYLERNERSGFVSARQRTELLALVPAYLAAMLLVAVSNNLGVLWIAVEATTLASVFLVAFQNRDTSLEAAWKFLVLGSVGLAFALLGTVLLFASGQGVLGEEMSALDWTRLLAHASALHPFTVKLAVVFLLVGYGTKAGLAPMHTWKPDAYREAPSPAGVLMAVGMMNCSLYALLRVHVVSRAVLGPEFSGRLLLGLGLASVLVATPFILIQWNLKRLLAYSSIEHVGIMAIGFGLGGEAATLGALLHMTYHTFAKPVAFFSAGTLAQLHRSSDFDAIGGGTLSRTPVASGLLLLATLMVTGSPPFGLFWSEMTILKAGFFGPHLAVVAVFLAALVVLFCGFFYQVGRLTLGPDTRPPDQHRPAGAARPGHGHDPRRRGRGRGLGVLPAGPARRPRPRGGPGRGGRMNPMIQAVSEALALPAASVRSPRPGELRADVEPGALPDVADRLVAGTGARLASLFATDERAWNAVYALHQVWLLPRHRTFLRVSTRVDPAHPRFPSIAAKHPVRQLVRARGDGHVRPRPRGPPQPHPRQPARRLARGGVGAAQGLPRRPEGAAGRGLAPPLPPGDGRGGLPRARGAGARRHHRARATSASAWPASPSSTCSSASSTCTRARRSASSGCRGVTGSSSPSPSPATRRWATRSPSPTRSRG